VQTYIAVVNKDPDSAFGLWFPDVEGCFSAANHEGDIVQNAREALSLHLDGIAAPQSRGIDETALLPEVIEALRNGAYLLAIPFGTTEGRAVRVNL
jgi:predicted RNase H-like HicB family nuclease